MQNESQRQRQNILTAVVSGKCRSETARGGMSPSANSRRLRDRWRDTYAQAVKAMRVVRAADYFISDTVFLRFH
jgi:hypothetical protein